MTKEEARQALWARRLWGKSKKRAKKDGIEFTISPGDIVVPLVCPIFGCTLEFQKGIADSNPSLDRVNNDLGYVPGNVRVISWRANYLKKDMSLEQMERMLKYMKGEI